jgi:hypothetical protein
LVKVTARIRSGSIFFSRSKKAMRVVITRVFPEPAPARRRRGPSVRRTAARCSGLSFAIFIEFIHEERVGVGGLHSTGMVKKQSVITKEIKL